MPGRPIVLLCVSILALPAVADVYTWTDDQGVTHFSDTARGVPEAEQVTPGVTSVIPMAGNVEQGRKVSDIHRQIQQMLERDKPTESDHGSGEKSLSEKQCDQLQARLQKVQQRLRAGYSNEQGNSLRRQRRALGQRYSRECVLG